MAGKKVMLTETGAGLGDVIPTDTMNLPRRIQLACQDKGVEYWYWYAFRPLGNYEPLATLVDGAWALTPMGEQFAAL
jgi:hypothetical protein